MTTFGYLISVFSVTLALWSEQWGSISALGGAALDSTALIGAVGGMARAVGGGGVAWRGGGGGGGAGGGGAGALRRHRARVDRGE